MNTTNAARKFVNLTAFSMSYADPALKQRWHSLGRAALRALAKQLDLPASSRDIRSNEGGIAVSGEIRLHTDSLYLQISQSALGRGYEIMYRTCNGRHDYTGGANHFVTVRQLLDLPGFARMLGRIGDHC